MLILKPAKDSLAKLDQYADEASAIIDSEGVGNLSVANIKDLTS